MLYRQLYLAEWWVPDPMPWPAAVSTVRPKFSIRQWRCPGELFSSILLLSGAVASPHLCSETVDCWHEMKEID